MKIITPNKKGSSELNSLIDTKNAIFLAGPCPRKNYNEDDWRTEAIEILKELNFDGVVLNPTNPNFKDINLEKQTRWELEAMYKASAIVFWIPRSEEHPALTTNIEIGAQFGKPGIFVGFPKNSWKNEYIKVRCDIAGQEVFTSLKTMLKAVVRDLTRSQKDWFISDTHFSQQKTFDIAKRPFRNIEDMDLNIISNWNKTVRMQDTVYYLGDFGSNFDILKCLNYKQMNFVLGNYEKDNQDYINELKKYKDIKIYNNDELVYRYRGESYILKHEPLGGSNFNYKKDNFYVFGHIHGKQCFKRNGVDVGVDGPFSRYFPIDSETLQWLRTAVLKYSDENVFTDLCL